MKRIARPPRRQAVAALSGLLLFAALPFLPGTVSPLGLAILILFALLIVWTALVVFVHRAIGTETGVELRALLPRRRLRAAYKEIVRYAPDAEGTWWVETMDRRVPVPVAEPWEFHAAMAQFAPETLEAKRLRPKYAPPEEEFRNLWLYDVEQLLSETLTRGVMLVLLVALTRQAGAAYGLLVAPLFFGVFSMFGRLDVTTEGLVRRGPFHRRSIPWTEAVAIFCERRTGRRTFVITSRETAIEIPDHLARDLELMRKVFRSLPEGVLCVNFDDSVFRGYRRRKKTEVDAPQDELMPALTTYSS